jgi:uncharacterized protein (TIGR03435 family)
MDNLLTAMGSAALFKYCSMRLIVVILLAACCCTAQGQALLKASDVFPDLVIRNIINAPVKEFDVHKQQTKFLILNFWGTWCSPCLPEMDSLAKLQVSNNKQIQVIGISDEPVSRLKKYLQRKPSTLWLASDTSSYLYKQFALDYVGQSAIIDLQHHIIALVRTDSINQRLINKLLKGTPIASSAETGRKQQDVEADLFAIDSTLGFQVSWSGYRAGLPGMSKSYLHSAFEGRRRSYFNTCLPSILRDMYGVSYTQVVYEVPEKTVCDYKDKQTLYCFDLLVRPEQKDSFYIIMRQLVNQLFPVKARLEKRSIPVYLLRRLPDAANWTASASTENTYSFSGRGFEGKGIAMKPFADYVSNELQLPVVDESGLTGKYDITTENALRTVEDMLAALKKLGLTVEKTNREMDVVVIYLPPTPS